MEPAGEESCLTREEQTWPSKYEKQHQFRALWAWQFYSKTSPFPSLLQMNLHICIEPTWCLWLQIVIL